MSVRGGQNYNVNVTDNTENTTEFVGEDQAKKKVRLRGKNGDNLQNYNFKSVAKIGLAIRNGRMFNEAFGAYTNNKLRQRRIETASLFAQYGIGIAVAGPFGAVYAGGDLAFRGLMYNIDIQKKNREANNLRDKAGFASRSNSRYSGGRL